MKRISVILLLCLLAVLGGAQNISSYSIITTGSVLKGGANDNVVLTQPMYEKLMVEQSALKNNEAIKPPGIVKVYPNPFSETITLIADMKEEGMMQVHIYNMLGAKIWDGTALHFASGINQQLIDLEGLKAGVYFLKAVTNNGDTESIIKLIKQ
jgi:hypothetical protein